MGRSTARHGRYGGASSATRLTEPKTRARAPGGPIFGLCTAVVLADQSKAFERMGTAWLRKVMDGWKFPRWVREAFDALLRARGVRACIGGVLGYVRVLARGLGMGNTPSPFPWCFGYDPIISAAFEATGVKPPTYVDDFSALVWGPEQALAVEIFIMAAGHAAGLRIDAHTRSSFHARSGIDAAIRILKALPVKIHAVGYQGDFRVTGIPGVLTRRILDPGFIEQWARLGWIEHFPCRCIVKTQVIPSSRVEEWAAALSESPFGPGSVSDHGPYLGACLHCRAHGSLAGTDIGDWHRHAADGARYATWTRATGTIVRRADESEQAIGPHAQKASPWNIYVISVAYFPAQIAEPTAEHRKAIRGAARTMVGAGKVIPMEFLHAMPPASPLGPGATPGAPTRRSPPRASSPKLGGLGPPVPRPTSSSA